MPQWLCTMALQQSSLDGNRPTVTLSNMCKSAERWCEGPNSNKAFPMASTRTWVAGILLGGTHLLFDSLHGHHRSLCLLCLRLPIGSAPLKLLQLGRIVKVFRLRLVPDHLILQGEAVLSPDQHCVAAGLWRRQAEWLVHAQQCVAVSSSIERSMEQGHLLEDQAAAVPSEGDAADWGLG